MSQGLHRFFRLSSVLVPILMMAGAMALNAHAVQREIAGDRIGSVEEPALQSIAANPMFPSRLAAQIDTIRIVPGTRDFLEPNAPNPFGIISRTTRLAFTIGEMSRVQLRIYDSFYNVIVTLVDQDFSPGRHEVRFNPPPTMPSGMYFYELKTNRFRDLRRMIYIK